MSQQACAFDPHRVHATQAWKGLRIVLIGFTVRGCERLSEEQRAEALGLGFVLPPLGTQRPANSAVESGPQPIACVRAPDPRAASSDLSSIDPPGFFSRVGSSAAFSPSRPLIARASVSLPPSSVGLLLSMPPGRFVISSAFPDLSAALSSGPGWLDLFSGSRGFAKALASTAPWR